MSFHLLQVNLTFMIVILLYLIFTQIHGKGSWSWMGSRSLWLAARFLPSSQYQYTAIILAWWHIHLILCISHLIFTQMQIFRHGVIVVVGVKGSVVRESLTIVAIPLCNHWIRIIKNYLTQIKVTVTVGPSSPQDSGLVDRSGNLPWALQRLPRLEPWRKWGGLRVQIA